VCGRLQIKKGGYVKKMLFNWGFQRKLFFMRQGHSYATVSI
jgi:hypothetical protein